MNLSGGWLWRLFRFGEWCEYLPAGPGELGLVRDLGLPEWEQIGDALPIPSEIRSAAGLFILVLAEGAGDRKSHSPRHWLGLSSLGLGCGPRGEDGQNSLGSLRKHTRSSWLVSLQGSSHLLLPASPPEGHCLGLLMPLLSS